MKKIILILMCIFVLTSLCGCDMSNSKQNDEEQTQIPENNNVETDRPIANEEDIITKLVNETPSGYQLYTWKVDMASTFANSIYPNDNIGIFVDVGKFNHIGYIITDIKVLAFLDKNNKSVFEDSSNIKEPNKILFYLTNEEAKLLDKSKTLKENKKLVSIMLVPIKSSQQKNQEVIDFILNN